MTNFRRILYAALFAMGIALMSFVSQPTSVAKAAGPVPCDQSKLPNVILVPTNNKSQVTFYASAPFTPTTGLYAEYRRDVLGEKKYGVDYPDKMVPITTDLGTKGTLFGCFVQAKYGTQTDTPMKPATLDLTQYKGATIIRSQSAGENALWITSRNTMTVSSGQVVDMWVSKKRLDPSADNTNLSIAPQTVGTMWGAVLPPDVPIFIDGATVKKLADDGTWQVSAKDAWLCPAGWDIKCIYGGIGGLGTTTVGQAELIPAGTATIKFVKIITNIADSSGTSVDPTSTNAKTDSRDAFAAFGGSLTPAQKQLFLDILGSN